MRSKAVTKDYYITKLGFEVFGSTDFDGYLMVQKDHIEIDFFEYKELDPKENYGQIYIRTNTIDTLYNSFLEKGISIHPTGHLQIKTWRLKEFSLLDPDNNLITFGEAI